MQNYTPHAKQAEAHQAFLVDGYDRGVLFWGRQVGKSLWSVKHLEMAACFKQGQYFIVFNTHKHAKDVMWRQYLDMIPKELVNDTNSTDLIITFNYIKGRFNIPGVGIVDVEHDPNKPPSTIQLLGSDYAYDHTGRKANGIIFDEYQDQDAESFTETYEPFFSTTRGWACFMGTPRGYNHWYEMIEDAKQESNKRWFYSEATWRDNPAVSKDFIAETRKDAERKGMLDIFLQQYELQFRTSQTSVYHMFDRKIHVIRPTDKRIPWEDCTVYGVLDFGWVEGHPMAFNLVLIDSMGKWFIVDEIHGTGINMDDLITMIRMKVGDKNLSGIVADSAQPALIEVARSKGLPVIPAPKHQNSIVAGIHLLGAKFQPKLQIIGEPEPDIYVTENCRRTIYQLENYKYKEPKQDRPASELPVKKDDDHPDALRYLALFLKYGPTQKRAPVKNRLKAKTGDFGMLKP